MRTRPKLNYKQLLTEQILVKNVPDLERDQQVILQLEERYFKGKKDLAETGPQTNYYKYVRNKTEEAKKSLGIQRDNNRHFKFINYMVSHSPYLMSIPDFNMKDFRK